MNPAAETSSAASNSSLHRTRDQERDDHNHDHSLPEIPSTPLPLYQSFIQEFWHSVDLILWTGGNKLTWLILGGPLAVIGDSSGILGEAPCFILAGLALIPCAERLSFVTEQVAEHTNGTIGALLNATFGNAPELLISVAALRSGYYRVVQLAMLGSMLTNLILVFGVACVIGGCRWQVQTLRITSGNVNVGMLLLGCAGFLLPAILIVSGQQQNGFGRDSSNGGAGVNSQEREYDPNVPSPVEILYSRVNAVVLMLLYIGYLIFQLGTHKDEYDEAPEGDDVVHRSSSRQVPVARHAQRNLFCTSIFRRLSSLIGMRVPPTSATSTQLRATINYEIVPSPKSKRKLGKGNGDEFGEAVGTGDDVESGLDNIELVNNYGSSNKQDMYLRSRGTISSANAASSDPPALMFSDSSTSDSRASPPPPQTKLEAKRSKDSDSHTFGNDIEDIFHDEDDDSMSHSASQAADNQLENTERFDHGPLISMRVGVVWLFVITLCVSALSDILVDTIAGFADRLHLSEVFTSMVIIPFFSNVAEQVSAFIFAYRDEMDLVVGVTVGSAVQIATFVLPGSVLIGYFLDRSMTLYFHPYETTCLVFGVVCVAAILQGGTTNWFVGAILVGVYVIIATGIWFHEMEDLSVDGEVAIRNQTDGLL
ncbi:hypothetical protein MPSEU_001026200 [Mayamaea pseudoterrestris]|nr:hypothetical protein MPSEU_001026200 [Mayamaea pseudoterrestris]